MERTKIETAQKIMGKNFIGPKELEKISRFFKIAVPKSVPDVPFEESLLKRIKKEYILILGIGKNNKGESLTINRMREMFGINPGKSEPCFYNQDWYLKEKFANKITLKPQWYLIKISVNQNTRAVHPDNLIKKLKNSEQFPLAILCAYTFFANYFLSKGKMLWEKDFVWCQDKDANGDRIYVGRYKDPKKINKNGFNIHRHLSIKQNYGLSPQIK